MSVIQYLCLWSFVFLSKLFLPSKSPTFLTSFLPCKSNPAYPIPLPFKTFPYLMENSPTFENFILPFHFFSYVCKFSPTFEKFPLPLKIFSYLCEFSPTFPFFLLPLDISPYLLAPTFCFSYLCKFSPTFEKGMVNPLPYKRMVGNMMVKVGW